MIGSTISENPKTLANEDSFVIVEVTGEATEPYSSIAPGFVPMAFSNPVFIDVP